MSQGPQNLTINYSLPQVKQLSDGSLPGVVMGQSPFDNISFYGKAPVPSLLQGSLVGANGVFNTYTTSQSPAAVTANTTTEYAMTVTGVKATDMVIGVSKPTAQAGLIFGSARVSGANTVDVSYGNLTGSTITPTTTESYIIETVPATLQFPAVTLSPASVAATTVQEQQFTVTGVQPGMSMAVNKPTLQAGLLITNVRAVAANTVGITFANLTGAAITPTASQSYLFYGAAGLAIQPVMETISATLSPVSVAANTSAEQSFTVNGLNAGTSVTVTKPSTTGGLMLGNARVSAANTLSLTFGNMTAAAITPPTETYIIGYYPEAAPAAGSTNAQLATVGTAATITLQNLGLTN